MSNIFNAKCKVCGGDNNVDLAKAHGVTNCEYCNSVITLPHTDCSPEVTDLLRQGDICLYTCEFDKAYDIYKRAVNKSKNEAEAYFGMALARFKVQYLYDEVNKRDQPICYDISEALFANDENYKKAIGLATEAQKLEYARRCGEIDAIRREFYRLKKSGEKYDCFICCKVTDGAAGNITNDAYQATRLHKHLEKAGYKPFYSEFDIKERIGAEYESLILYALYSAKCMIVICSKDEYLRTDWVKNEYTRFLRMIGREEKAKGALAIAYFDSVIERLPGSNKRYQGVCLNSPDAYTIIDGFVGNYVSPAKPSKKYCLSCGTENSAKAKFCSECGKTEFAETYEKYTEIKQRKKLEAEYNEKLEAERKAREQAEQRLADLEREQAERKEQEEREHKAKEVKEKEEAERRARIDLNDFEIKDGVLIKYKGKGGDVIIPNSVTSIGNHAFQYCKSLTSIEIPQGVTSIGERAFAGCSSLTSIEIPNSVTSIGNHALWNCNSLTSITIPNSVTSIGIGAFLDCSRLTGIEIPNSVTSIVESAFNGCSGLTIIEIPNSVTSIGKNAFWNCSSLTSIEIPNSVTSIGDGAFFGCFNLTSITVQSGNKTYHSKNNCIIKTASKELVVGCKNSIIPTDGRVTSIGLFAFGGCGSLTSIEIPNTVTRIVANAFAGCRSLTSIEIPNSVTIIGYYAFHDCSSLTSIEIPSSVTSIGYYVFAGCRSLMSINYNGTEEQWNNVEKGEDWDSGINENCKVYFNSGSVAKKEVRSNDDYPTLQNYDKSAFEIDGTELKKYIGKDTKAEVPSGVTSIGEYAFDGCSSLTNIEIPNSVTNIGNGAFWGCSSLTGIEIPSSVTSIGRSAFSYCIGLTSLTVQSGNKTYHSKNNCIIDTASRVLVVGCKNSVIPADGSVTSIGWCAFSGCSSLTRIEIPNSVTSIGSYAFFDCSSLTCIEIPNSVTSIGSYALSLCSCLMSIVFGGTEEQWNSIVKDDDWDDGINAGCKICFGGLVEPKKEAQPCADYPTLQNYDKSAFEIDGTELRKYKGTDKKVKIPNGITVIGLEAFSGCRYIKAITIPNSVKCIGAQAFWGCSSLTSIEIPNSVKRLEGGAFKGCSSLKTISIPNSVTDIVFYEMFSHCNLRSVTIPSSVINIGDLAFHNCSNLKTVMIPNSVKSIGMQAFRGCSKLTSIEIPDSVTSIAEGAFSDCCSLTSIVIPNNVMKIDTNVFTGCRGLKRITIPNSVFCINNYAFSSCSGLTSIEIPNRVTSIGRCAFSDCYRLTIIVYNGTVEQWNNVQKGKEWNRGIPKECRIYCTDGELKV